MLQPIICFSIFRNCVTAYHLVLYVTFLTVCIFIFCSACQLRMPLKEVQKSRILTLKECTSKSNREIAADMQVSHTAINKFLIHWQRTGSLSRNYCGRSGRPSALTKREKAVIVRTSKKEDPRLFQVLTNANAKHILPRWWCGELLHTVVLEHCIS